MTHAGRDTPFFRRLAAELAALGGQLNAHLHLDRALTLDDRYLAIAGTDAEGGVRLSLPEKHALLHGIHAGPAYEPDDLRRRVSSSLDQLIRCGARRADTLCDVTADRVGTSALDVMLELRAERAAEIDLRIGAYSPLGFRDDEPERWAILERAAPRAQFLACLPEVDDIVDHPGHVGFEEHCRRHLRLARALGVPLHVHTDQRVLPSERGTERLCAVVREEGTPPLADGEPSVWAVHVISPSTYDDRRFDALVRAMVELHIGVVSCPSAALGMRQLRPIASPTTNSIPRVLELLAAGVPVRLASDNVADLCSPSTTFDLVDEIYLLSAALRFYDVGVLARLAAGRTRLAPYAALERERARQAR